MSIPGLNFFSKKIEEFRKLLKNAVLRNPCRRQNMGKRIKRSGYTLETGEIELPGGKKTPGNTDSGNGDHKENMDEYF